jgi:cobalt-precorrin 5A hydrolase/precorrin-3B C17-methyltransferase
MSAAPALVALSAGGAALAERLRAELPGARLHGRRGRVEAADVLFDDAPAHLRALFAAGTPIVGLCAAGILARALAPLLADKSREPPVVAVAEDGSAVVPLLGGHRGANALARRIAAALGVAPAITTAGEKRLGLALDDPPDGWRLGNPADAKPFAAALLAGARVRLAGAAAWLAASALPWDDNGGLVIHASERALAGSPTALVYHPATLALGLGCERGASAEEVIGLARATLAEAGLAPQSVAGVFSLELKAGEPAIHAAAAAFGVPARFFAARRLEAETPRLKNPSDLVFRETGCPGVAEAAALAAAGEAAELIVPKRKSARATCAIARAAQPIDAAACGRPQGRLAIVGIGPGDAAWRTPEASALLAEATDLVGYRLYLDLVEPRAAGQKRHDFELGEEEARVRTALDLAAAGRSVALVSSGDPGIYAMASLVFETIERGDAAWARIAVTVAPGISALQAAAARAGAPLGHDFCAISLSDLLTPWPAIERRIAAAAAADFVIAFYNPVSRRRVRQIARAREILLAQRAGATPVVVARNLGRPGESVAVTTLADLAPEACDMLTLVLVGSSATRALAAGQGRVWVYTPRGYADKPAARAAP